MKRLVLVIGLGALIFLIGQVASGVIRSDDMDAPDSAERYGLPLLVFAEAHYGDPHPYFSRAALWANFGFALLSSGLLLGWWEKFGRAPSVRR